MSHFSKSKSDQIKKLQSKDPTKSGSSLFATDSVFCFDPHLVWFGSLDPNLVGRCPYSPPPEEQQHPACIHHLTARPCTAARTALLMASRLDASRLPRNGSALAVRMAARAHL
jgi:hypothetical protein